MIIMNKIFYTSLFFFCVGFASAQKTKYVTVSGRVTGDLKGSDLVYRYIGGLPPDSVQITNGRFKMEVAFSEPFILSLVSQYDKVIKRGYRAYNVLIDGTGDIHLDMDIEKGFTSALIKGSSSTVAYHKYLKGRDSVYIKIAGGLKTLYGKSYVPSSDPLAATMSRSRDSLSKIYMGGYISTFVEDHHSEYVALYVLNTDGKGAMDIDMLDHNYTALPTFTKQSPEGRKLGKYISGVQRTITGATALNFTLKDHNGKLISLSDLRGKYVWIDFWASWCGPCKQAFPHMRNLYSMYKDKGLEIVGISVDSKVEPWLKILPSLTNPWYQLWDDQDVMLSYAVTALPTSFLLDTEGKIILKEVGYEPNGHSAMDKKLAELFGTAH